jgi:hypothetical protein
LEGATKTLHCAAKFGKKLGTLCAAVFFAGSESRRVQTKD